MVNSDFKQVTILNRTLDKAEKLANRCGFAFGSIDQLKEEILKADVIISSVSGNEPIISRALVNDFKILSPKYFIDLSILT